MSQELTVEQFCQIVADVETEVAQVIVNQHDVLRHILVALICGGHVLLEGVPGLGKMVLVRTLAQILDLSFARLQLSPDLTPADIVGTDILEKDVAGRRQARFQAGTIFANLILADEINRATPRTQSALLEAMEERTVTVAHRTYPLPQPFFVAASQNPFETEGIHSLSQAQSDRFLFKLDVAFPNAAELSEILERTTSQLLPQVQAIADGPTILRMGDRARQATIAGDVRDYAARLLLATQPDHPTAPDVVRRYVRHGAGPRGAQAMVLGAKVIAILEERSAVSPVDLRSLALPALCHRLRLNAAGEDEGITADAIIEAVLEAVPEKEGE